MASRETNSEDPRQKRLATLQESRNTSRQTLKQLEETKQTATHTMTELEKQGKSIVAIQEKMDKIQDNVHRSNRLITSIESFVGQISNSFRSKPPPTRTPTIQPGTKPAVHPPQQTWSEYLFGKKKSEVPSNSPSKEMLSSLSEEEKVFYQETEKDLDEMSIAVKQLKEMAQSMNTEIGNQTKNLETLTTTVDRADAGIKKSNQRIRKLL